MFVYDEYIVRLLCCSNVVSVLLMVRLSGPKSSTYGCIGPGHADRSALHVAG